MGLVRSARNLFAGSSTSKAHKHRADEQLNEFQQYVQKHRGITSYGQDSSQARSGPLDKLASATPREMQKEQYMLASAQAVDVTTVLSEDSTSFDAAANNLQTSTPTQYPAKEKNNNSYGQAHSHVTEERLNEQLPDELFSSVTDDFFGDNDAAFDQVRL